MTAAVPDLHRRSQSHDDGDAAQADLQLFDVVDSVNFVPNYNGAAATPQMINGQKAPSNLDIKSPADIVPPTAFWPPLKAVPLASYYKLHRVPSFPAMDEQQQNSIYEVPRSDNASLTGGPNGVHSKLLDQVIRTPGRQPSPQPTHLSVPSASHRVLHEEGPGYVAPIFEGKEQQMDQGSA